jgi:hypothetical protein
MKKKPLIARSAKCTKIARIFDGGRVEYRGKLRRVIAELNTSAGTITFRLEGCATRKVYNAVDLATFKPATPQLALQLEFDTTPAPVAP